MTTSPLSRLVLVHKAIGHNVRLRLLAMLRGGPLCVCQMTAVVNLATSTVSEHLADLRQAGLIAERKQGRWVEYRLADGLDEDHLLDALWPMLEGDREIAADAVVLKELRRVPVDALCSVGRDLERIDQPRLAAALSKAAEMRSGKAARR